MTIFTTLYDIMGITGGEIYLRFNAGSTLYVDKSTICSEILCSEFQVQGEFLDQIGE